MPAVEAPAYGVEDLFQANRRVLWKSNDGESIERRTDVSVNFFNWARTTRVSPMYTTLLTDLRRSRGYLAGSQKVMDSSGSLVQCQVRLVGWVREIYCAQLEVYVEPTANTHAFTTALYPGGAAEQARLSNMANLIPASIRSV